MGVAVTVTVLVSIVTGLSSLLNYVFMITIFVIATNFVDLSYDTNMQNHPPNTKLHISSTIYIIQDNAEHKILTFKI
jgi:hypothetical protein